MSEPRAAHRYLNPKYARGRACVKTCTDEKVIEFFFLIGSRWNVVGHLMRTIKYFEAKRSSTTKNSRCGLSLRASVAWNGILKAFFTLEFLHGLGLVQPSRG
jgi:hypothetical protein